MEHTDPDSTGRAGNRQPAGGGLGLGRLELGQSPRLEQGEAAGSGSFWELLGALEMGSGAEKSRRYPGSSPSCSPAGWHWRCGVSPGIVGMALGHLQRLFQGCRAGFPCFPWMLARSCPSAPQQGSRAPLARVWGGGSWCSGASQSCHHPGREKLAVQESWKWLQKEGEQMDLGSAVFFPSSQRSCLQVPWLSAAIPKAGSCWITQALTTRDQIPTGMWDTGSGVQRCQGWASGIFLCQECRGCPVSRSLGGMVAVAPLILPHSSRFQGVFYPNPSKLWLPLLLSPSLAGSWDISVGWRSSVPAWSCASPAEAARAGTDLGAKGSLAPAAPLLRLFQLDL